MSLLFRPYRPIVRLVAGVAPWNIPPSSLQAKPAGLPSGSAAGLVPPEGGPTISRAQPHQSTRAGTWPGAPPSPEGRRRPHRRDRVVSGLERLARLYEAGQLDDSEYAAAKSRLLRS
jgi:hypothetical protein